MAITRFGFVDTLHDWTLQEMSFSSLNLLVGKSGVGKTNILNALQSVQQAGTSGAYRANGCEWEIEIESEKIRWRWEAEVSRTVETGPVQFANGEEDEHYEQQGIEKPYFVKERILRHEGDDIVNRTKDHFFFQGKTLPKLKNTESAISLLAEENAIAPLYKALCRMVFSQSQLTAYPFDLVQIRKIQQRYPNLETLKEARDVPALIKAYILQEKYPQVFESIRTDYTEIFETVEDIRLGRFSELAPSRSQESLSTRAEDWLVVGMKEEGVEGWIVGHRISSGMNRVFSHLLDLALAPPGTVIVIDEVENSLGVNCLPELTDRFLRRPQKLQCILTSHHPYIIQNIPAEQWRIVTRKGSNVRVIEAKFLPALRTCSAHDKFLQLINLKEFEEGIR